MSDLGAGKPANAPRALLGLFVVCLLAMAVVSSRNSGLDNARRAIRLDTLNARGGTQPPGAADLSRSPAAIRARLAQSYGKLPLSFEPNLGQTGQPVKFLSRGKGYTLFLTSQEAVLLLRHGTAQPPAGSVVRMKLAGANGDVRIVGVDQVTGRSNYFTGSDPAAWRTNIPNYAKVEYQQVYPGVDLVYYGTHGELECDFVVAPRADPAVIDFKIDGARSVKISRQGDLELEIQGGEVRFRKPQLYQPWGGGLRPVAGKYVLRGENEAGFEVRAYDRTAPLVIDPILAYSTYLGGTNNNLAEAVAVDSLGNAYLTGDTFAVNFPTTTNPIQQFLRGGADAFVTKVNPQGTALAYSTYLGGAAADNGTAIAVDGSGNAYVTGSTLSTNFPFTANAVQTVCKGCLAGMADVFVAKIDPTGSTLVYATYLGGSQGNTPGGIAADSSGNAYVTGTTSSTDFNTANPFQAALKGTSDGFVSKVNPQGTALVYSTYLGGTHAEVGQAIAVDSSGAAYVTGTTGSTDFPVSSSAIQSTCQSCNSGPSPFVTKLNASGSGLVYSTYLGGTSGKDASQAMAVDGAGNAYVTGHVESNNFPLAGPLQATLHGSSDAFVTKINAAGSALVYSTYLGGTGGEDLVMGSIAADQFGNAYVTGDTTSPDFPTTGAIQASRLGPNDAFVAMLNSTGSALFFSTYLGGVGTDYGRGVAVDGSGSAYVAGSTNSADFPTTAGAFATACNTCGMFTDGFLAKLSVPSFSIAAASGASTSAAVTAGNTATYNLQVVPFGGFSGTLSLSCSGTIPSGSCSATTPSIALSGSPVAFMVTATTMSRATVAPLPQWRPGLPALLCWLALSTLLVWSAATRQRARLPLALLILLVGLSISCSGGSSSPPPAHGTSAGTYSLTITATSGAFSNSTPLTLTVN